MAWAAGDTAGCSCSSPLLSDFSSWIWKQNQGMGEGRAGPSLKAQAPEWEQHHWGTLGVPILPCLHQLPFFKLMADGHEKYSK